MADGAATTAGVGLGLAGASAGSLLANSDLANALLIRRLTQGKPGAGAPDFRVPVYAGAGYNLQNGSGEAVMASRISRLLNRNGVGSFYVNALEQPTQASQVGWTPEVVRNADLWVKGNAIDHRSIGALNRISADLYGKKGTALSLILRRFKDAGVPPDKALALLRSGAFDGYTPGELLDTFKVIGNKGIAGVVNGTEHVMPTRDFLPKFDKGEFPNVMTGEVGMNYNSVNESRGPGPRTQQGYTTKRVEPTHTALDSHPYLGGASKTRNLALDTRFQANYRAPSDPLIPASDVADPGRFRRSPLARRVAYGWSGFDGIGKKRYLRGLGGFGQRAEMQRIIDRIASNPENGLDPRTLGRNTKYMLISTGSAGPNAAEKLRLATKAFENDPNVRILMQYGKKPSGTGVDMFSPNGIMEEIQRANAKRPGFVIHTPRIDPADYKKLTGAVDLHGIYGGSSSVTEAMSNTNPGVMMHDSRMNRANNNYAAANRRYTVNGRMVEPIKSVDTTATALRPLIANGAPDSTDLGRGYTLGQAMKDTGVTRNTNFEELERKNIQAIRDAMYRSPSRFDPHNVASANKVVRDQASRNRSFVQTVRNAIADSINARDDAAIKAMKPGVGKFYKGLSRVLNKTPVGRRIGIPLAIAGALGLGGGAYAALKK